jgi:hypothetical protein
MMHNLGVNVPICQCANMPIRNVQMVQCANWVDQNNLYYYLNVFRETGLKLYFEFPALLETIILVIIFSISFSKQDKCSHEGYDFEF